ncbi:energy-coupling factor transport system substrate-specific component [Natranaerovirga pectinivora]|uniref:Energy-coupling factor transport system substrate-specific component n=1 Tax=Natranaerovirga pectinivora TaxID=682400 RepID=A0A4R3MMC2_9FIRM|nr:hypothetical protein [Natranaerovirga pectinivora]TCT15443.1 energy-coupling factor transport system substrate-specific component [Natranaerovirga pectinivora]
MNQKIIALTYSAITVSILFVGGFVLYSLSSALAIPGNRFVLLAPFLSFVFYFPLAKIRKFGLLTKINVVFALVLSYISIFMGLAIISSGLLTDLTGFVLFKKLNKEYTIVITSSIYPVYATLTSFYVTTYLTAGSNMFGYISYKVLIILLFIIYFLGLLGSLAAYKLKSRVFSSQNK